MVAAALLLAAGCGGSSKKSSSTSSGGGGGSSFTAALVSDIGKFNGYHDLQFTLANGGMGLGKINPAVPKALIDKMNGIKQRIISGDPKAPTTIK